MFKDSKIIKAQWIIIVVFTILIGLLIYQNIQIKFGYSRTENNKNNASYLFEKDLEEKLLFKKFPIPIQTEEFYFYKEDKADFVSNYLIAVFDFTVCGKCLHEELALLNQFKEKLKDKKISTIAIVGIINKKEESLIIEFHSTGELFFPCKSMPVHSMYQSFKLNNENFIDTPFYIYTSHQFQVLDVFKPQSLDTKEFEKWLEILTNQDIY